MKTISLYSYSINFKKNPFSFSLDHRKGFILLFNDSIKGSFPFEINPLPFFSKESIPEVKDQLLNLFQYFKSNKNLSIDKAIHRSSQKLLPSVEWALMRASLYQKESRIFEKNIITQANLISVPINYLISQNLDEFNTKLLDRHLLCQSLKNTRYLKIKIGRKLIFNSDNNNETSKIRIKNESIILKETNLIKKILSINPNIKLILDANRKLIKTQLEQYFQLLNSYNILYFEDPLSSHQELLQVLNENNIPLALDESLNYIDSLPIHSLNKIKAFVIKPPLFGYIQTEKILKIAEKEKIKVTLSSSFESLLGIIDLIYFYYEKKIHNTVSPFTGLDTLQYFDNHSEFYFTKNGYLTLNIPDIKDYLKKINAQLLDFYKLK